jgi:peroxiredoxin
MKGHQLLLIFVIASLHIFGQKTQPLTERMKECFGKCDSIKINNITVFDWKDQEKIDNMCNCLKGSCIDNFNFKSIQGDSLSMYTFNKPILIFLFARFCQPCMAEIYAINYLFEKYSNQIVFLGITCDSFNTLESYWNKYNPKIILVPSPTEKMWQSYMYKYFCIGGTKTLPIPTVYFVDKNKIITDIKVGAEEEFLPKKYGITDPTLKEISKETADSINIVDLEQRILQLLNNK